MWMEQFTTFTTKEFIDLCVILLISVGGFIAVLVAIFRSEKDFTENENYKKLVGDVSKLSKEERMRKERANGIVWGN
jgi:hypothetical protein